MSCYSATKHGVRAFSASLRREVATFGVKVSCIEPGFMKTNIINTENMKQNLKTSWNNASGDVREAYKRKVQVYHLSWATNSTEWSLPQLSLIRVKRWYNPRSYKK